MAAQLLVLYSQPKDPAAFEAYYMDTHDPIAKRLPGLRKYTITRGALAIVAGELPLFLVATLEFDDMAAIGAAFASPEGQAAAADVANFATGGVTRNERSDSAQLTRILGGALARKRQLSGANPG